MTPQFARSANDKVIAGVCGGLGHYFGIDPVLVRLLFVVSVFFAGVSPLVYLVLWLIMPQEQPAPPVASLPHIANHPRPVDQWKFDPYTGELIRR